MGRRFAAAVVRLSGGVASGEGDGRVGMGRKTSFDVNAEFGAIELSSRGRGLHVRSERDELLKVACARWSEHPAKFEGWNEATGVPPDSP